MATFPSLLNVGEPIVIDEIAPPVATATTVSPFASQLTAQGLLPISRVTLKPRLLPSAAPLPPAPPSAPVMQSSFMPSPDTVDDYDVAEPDNSDGAFSDLNPGRSLGMSIASALLPGPFGLAIGALNAYNGYQAQNFNQNLAGLKRSSLQTGLSSFGIGNDMGIGGYGPGNRGGYTGAMNYTDPGVAGLARGMARSALDAAVGYDPASWSYSMDPNFGYEDISADDVDTSNTGYDVDPDFGYEDFSESDVGDSGDGGDGDSGGGDTHICTAAFKAGISPRERFRENKKYGIKLRREDPVLMRGYDIVGPWIAKKIGHTKMGNALTRLYAAKAGGEKLSAKQKILDATLNLTTRPALRLVGRFA